jgi:DNA-binding transcriptional LysR family regulator
VSLAASPLVFAHPLQQVICERHCSTSKQKAPQIELAIVERSRTQLAAALRNGVLDVLIVTGSVPIVGGNTLALWSERILAVLHEDHPLTSRKVVYWTDLRDETVLLSQCDPGREIEDLLVSKLILPDGRPKIERHDISRGVIKSLVMMKLGVSLVLESDIGATLSGLAYRELRDGAGPARWTIRPIGEPTMKIPRRNPS